MKRLEKLRDELANEWPDDYHRKALIEGFDAATSELMRVIEILKELDPMIDCGCECGNQYEPEFICRGHRTLNRAQDILNGEPGALK